MQLFNLMKVNFIKRAIYMALTAGMILTSCSDNLSDEGENKGKTDGKVGYLSLALINGTVRGMTRAEGGLHYGTADENKVNTVLVVLYDGEDPTSKVMYQYELNGGTVAAPGDDMVSISPGSNATTYKTKAQEVIRADYKLAVFINYPSELVGITEEGDEYQEILAAASPITVDNLTKRGGVSSGAQDNFLMSNFAGLVDVLEADIFDTENEAIGKPVAVEVERAVAKVTLTKSATFSTGLNATIGEIKWDVDVINKKTFWMRQPAPMLDHTTISPTEPTKTIDEIATKDNRKYMYAIDPNWDDFSNSRLAGSTADLTVEFSYKSGPIALNYEPTTFTTYPDPVNKDTYAYVTENTMNAADQWEDVTTTVLISAIITPDETFFGQGLNPGEPYFLYRNMAFTLEDMQEILAAYDDQTVTITSASSTWEDLVKLPENTPIVTLPAILNGMKGTEDFNNFTNSPLESKDVIKSNGTVSYFAAGAPNYYYVPIRHFSDAFQSAKMAYGRYGVVRNNWYNLTLNSINNYGTGEIPEDRPNPDDVEKSYLSVEFEILPWIEREQGIEL